jgi:hypothetical protein
MSTELNTFPIYFSLIERRGEKTDRLITEIIDLSKQLNVYEEISLVSTSPASTAGPDENKLIYCIQISSPNNKKANDIITFLEYIFQKMFDKYPAFTEPETV